MQITDWLKQQYSNVQFTSINSGIGGTGSDLGVFRTERDVLQYHPDLVFVEFAVNDAKTDSLVIAHSWKELCVRSGIIIRIRIYVFSIR